MLLCWQISFIRLQSSMPFGSVMLTVYGFGDKANVLFSFTPHGELQVLQYDVLFQVLFCCSWNWWCWYLYPAAEDKNYLLHITDVTKFLKDFFVPKMLLLSSFLGSVLQRLKEMVLVLFFTFFCEEAGFEYHFVWYRWKADTSQSCSQGAHHPFFCQSTRTCGQGHHYDHCFLLFGLEVVRPGSLIWDCILLKKEKCQNGFEQMSSVLLLIGKSKTKTI